MENYILAAETEKKWGLRARKICILCTQGRIPGTIVFSRSWSIPKDAQKSTDACIKNGKYIGFFEKYHKNFIKKVITGDRSSSVSDIKLFDVNEDMS